ncbi:MAG TPA: FtsQ-type POTRA domain-containing protein [Kofleriaceae bacterium]|nr:FtsQ-type POTRA domain-containing protein [Kofleriaceae bacterium]
MLCLPAALTALAIAAVVAGGVFGYRWLTGSERFAVAEVEVRGARALPAAEVQRVVAPAYGQNVFRVSLAAIERRLRAEPWIAAASVRRSLPDTLVVEVQERRAAAVAELGGLYLVDERGQAFKRADVGRGEAAGLLVVTGIDRDDYRRAPAEAAARIRASLEAARTYREGSGRPELGEVKHDALRGMTLFTRRPVVAIRVGHVPGPATLRRRLAAFDAAWAALAPGERAAASTFHLDRDGAPLRVTVGFNARGTHPWPE